jgi:hypothetical protein
MWLQAKYENNCLKTFFYIFDYMFETFVKLWKVALNFFWIMAIENLKKTH